MESKEQLSVAMDLVNQLRIENESFRQNFENLKVAHVRLQETNNELRRQVAESRDAKLAAERAHEDFSRQIKVELEKKTQEFDEMRSQIVPTRELEKLRMRIVEEVEAPHRERVQSLEREADKFQDQYLKARRENGLLRTKYQNLLSEQNRMQEDLNVQRSSEALELTERIRNLQKMLDGAQNDDRLRNTLRDKKEIEAHVQTLLEENQHLRSQKEVLRVDREQLVATHAQLVHEKELQIKSVIADRDNLLKKVQKFESEGREMEAENEQLHRQLASKESQLSHQKLEFDSARRSAQWDGTKCHPGSMVREGTRLANGTR
mmetsp:Transcript_40128/g.67061  ORF Transcript_40128/g.67061 Transcript_40128/m.67061 type:complete len:320 (-) Transcript_40128:1643-2602(-)